eukprot:9469941-Pyramimonas_sp.AAC.1
MSCVWGPRVEKRTAKEPPRRVHHVRDVLLLLVDKGPVKILHMVLGYSLLVPVVLAVNGDAAEVLAAVVEVLLCLWARLA